MIVDPDHNNMSTQTPPENPPPYAYTTETEPAPSSSDAPKPTQAVDMKQHPIPDQTPIQVYGVVGPSHVMQPGYIASPTVYHYTNPATNQHITSLLPPDHPEMVCLQAGAHVPYTSYGIVGILAAVLWFPLGIGLCLLDRRVRCTRCGAIINDGICG